MYRALITDLDGTAVKISSDGSDVTDSTKQILEQAQEKDIKIACATGREWELAKPVVMSLGIGAACIVEGGTRIVDPKNGDSLWERSLIEGATMEILRIFKQFTSQGLVMSSQNTDRQKLSEVNMFTGEIRFVYLLGVSAEQGAEIINTINNEIDAVAHMTPSWMGEDLLDIHVTDKQATKEHAITIWQQMENVTIEETIGMGDSGNDIPLFNSSGLKVAVDNATSELKALADYIAPSVQDGSLEHVVKKFFLVY